MAKHKPSIAPMRKAGTKGAPMRKGTTGLPSGSPSMPNNKEYAARAGNKGPGNKHLEGAQTKTGLGYGS